ncbi:MAG: alkaline phosphatase D family protein [Phycisphaeraceae bacterium]|nr:alkaline phosphatase D family protein [Phycisphaeraceae bacterium]
MHDSTKLSRRQFLGASLASLPLASMAFGQNESGRKPVAAVLEHRENWTGKTAGAALMLEAAGFTVIDLNPPTLGDDVSVSRIIQDYYSEASEQRVHVPRYEFSIEPDIQKVDLHFFGTFTNHGQPYHDYLRRYAARIPDFVKAGGVVMEMCQWARYDAFHPGMLPAGMELVREPWSATSDVIVAAEHPLVTPWAGPLAQRLDYPLPDWRPERPWERQSCWQCVSDWQQMRVLLAAGGGYRGHQSDKPTRAAMLEAEHGRGRYVFSSLLLDKLYAEDGQLAVDPATLRVAEAFFAALHEYVLQVRHQRAPHVTVTAMPPEPWLGPMLGHIDHEQAIVWVRPAEHGRYTLVVRQSDQQEAHARRIHENAEAAGDGCIHWRLNELTPDTEYQYRIERDGQAQLDGRTFTFRTAPHPDAPSRVTIAVGSCLSSTDFPEIWPRIESEGVQGMLLLGDTPYIDSTDTLHNRLKHRELLAYPPVAKLASTMPVWGTWDDHDFGANASDGRIHNRQGIRQAFTEYRALNSFGEDGRGIYTRFRRGPLEVFILDTRYFWMTEPSFADPNKLTLIGRQQWNWLCDGLKSSTAPFKVLASGMMWDPKSANAGDCWMSCPREHDAVLDFIGREGISGVMLVGGDIHGTRVVRYQSEQRIGYPLYHLVSSPMHDRTAIAAASAEHEGMVLLFSKDEANTFLNIAADTTVNPSVLTATWINMAGEHIYKLNLNLDDLRRQT